MDLHRLERFAVLARERNYSRAAEKLNIPQPHLSKQIKQLETELGVTLFERTRPLITLTLAGTIFLQEVERILAQLEQAAQLAKRASQGEIGRLSIGINTSISNSLLPDILQVFQSRFPDVELVLQELLVKESQTKLMDGTIDVDFDNTQNLQNIDAQHALTYEVIRQESLVMVLPETHALAQKPQVWLQDLDGESFVMPSPDLVPGLYTTIWNLCQQAGIHLHITQEAAWMTTVLSLVAGGIGVSLLPANVVNLQRSGVVYREIQDSTALFQLAIVWRHKNSSKALYHFLAVVREIAQRVVIWK